MKPSVRNAAAVIGILGISLIAWVTLRSKQPSLPEIHITPPESLPKLDHSEIPEEAEMPSEKPIQLYSKFAELWTTQTTRHPLSPALAVTESESQRGLLYLGTSEGTLDAYDLISGKLKWRLKKRQPIFSAPVSWGESRIFIGEGLHANDVTSFTAIEATSGTPLWQLELDGHIETAATSLSLDDEDTIFFGGGRLGLLAVAPLTGRILWRQPLGHVDSTSLIRMGASHDLWTLAQPTDAQPRSQIFKLDLHSGEWKGSAELEGQPWGSPLAMSGAIFVTTGIGGLGPVRPTDRGWLHKIDPTCPSDGQCKVEWSKPLPTLAIPRLHSFPNIGLIYVTTKTGKVLAYRGSDGTLAWTFDLGASTKSEAMISTSIALDLRPPKPGMRKQTGALMAALQSEGKVFLLDPFTGQVIRTLKTGRDSTSPPVFLDDRLILISPSQITTYGGVSRLAKTTQGM